MKEVRGEKSIPWLPLAAHGFHDRQPSYWHALLKGAPSSCSLPPPLPHIVLLAIQPQAIQAGAAEGSIAAHAAKCAVLLLCFQK